MSDSYADAIRKISEDATARSRAADDLLRAFMRVRADLAPSGWVLMDNRAPPQGDHFLVGFTMRRDGQDVDQCVFKVGPGRLVQFEGRGEPNFTGSLDDTGEADFHRLIENWAGTVQAQAFKRPLLNAADGVEFFGAVSEIEDDLWRATYHVRGWTRAGQFYSEQPDSEPFGTKEEGQSWLNEVAVRRGFARWRLETGDPVSG